MKTIIVIATLAVTVGTASAQYLGNSNRGSSYGSSGLVSVIECFETDGGVNYRSDRLIWF